MKMIITGKVVAETKKHVVVKSCFGLFLAIKSKLDKRACVPCLEVQSVGEAIEYAYRMELKEEEETPKRPLQERPQQKQCNTVEYPQR